jgi:hypothetical protein
VGGRIEVFTRIYWTLGERERRITDMRIRENGTRISRTDPAVRPVHYMTGSSSVACGARMGHYLTNPTGWDLGNATTAWTGVTCPLCKK